MINLLNSPIGEQLAKAQLLSDSQAWMELFTYDLKQEIIRDWIQNDQLTKRGVDANGDLIGTYSQATELFTGGRKKAGDHYTLEDQGHFYASMFLTVLIDELQINADFQKMADQKWWTDEILGLTDENIKNLAQVARTKYADYVRKILGLN